MENLAGVEAPVLTICENDTPALSGDDRETANRASVERVLLRVREHATRTFSLGEMASIALMSPYHFNRVFRGVTGLPPRVFQSMLRLEGAKRLLASTDMSIVDVCFEAGYSSVGTFTRRFTEMVGLPPNRFRRLARASRMGRGEAARPTPPACAGPGCSIAGELEAPAAFAGQLFVAAFPGPIPCGRPAGCEILEAPAGRFRIGGLRAGTYYIAALGIARGTPGADAVLHEAALRDRCGPLSVRGDVALRSPLRLRPANVTDVPILLPIGILEAGGAADANRMALFMRPSERQAIVAG